MNWHLGELVVTEDGSYTLKHPTHGECYHARQGAFAEARLLYVESSGIIACFESSTRPVTVLDVGLGLAYNAVSTLDAWAAAVAPPPLEILSLEIDPQLVEALMTGAAPWQDSWTAQQRLFGASLVKETEHVYVATIAHPRSQVTCRWSIVVGDAVREALMQPSSEGLWQFVWQDPFSPEKNPSMWVTPWFAKTYQVAAPGCVLMTYSVARSVRNALEAAGWTCERFAAPAGHKRQWLRATKA